ncbi:LysE family translocator [Trinickia sp. NRRL B-1857]|uniref:LysE family translocator n=1 Tax=Trinickia sp. NRRL B-1857 TaxID=3162879 RepID=UPI003D27E9AA
MSIAAHHGRKAALAFAAGVISGSMFWASVATLGISAALIAYSHFYRRIKIFAASISYGSPFKSGRTALSASVAASSNNDRPATLKGLYTKGVLLHLTNPKQSWCGCRSWRSRRIARGPRTVPLSRAAQ